MSAGSAMGAERLPRSRKRAAGARDRVTIDLRGMGSRLHMLASRRRTPASVLVRRAVVAMLDAEVVEGDQDDPAGGDHVRRVAKITLRMPAEHALLLAKRARGADVSQGAYVASLLEGTPAPPRAPDYARVVEALLVSSNRLADLSPDLNGIARLVARDPKGELARYAGHIDALAADVRQHIAVAAALLTSLRPTWGRR